MMRMEKETWMNVMMWINFAKISLKDIRYVLTLKRNIDNSFITTKDSFQDFSKIFLSTLNLWKQLLGIFMSHLVEVWLQSHEPLLLFSWHFQ